MTRTSTLRCVAGDVQEIALFVALGADSRWCRGGEREPTLGTFPEGETALRTDIPLKLSLRRVAAKGARLSLFLSHHLAALPTLLCVFPVPLPL